MDENKYAETRWNGSATAVIESETNPWLRGSAGDVNLLAIADVIAGHPGTPLMCEPCDCPFPGVLIAMDTNFGIQRCDACAVYPGDLEAATALAEFLSAELFDDLKVWFHGCN